LPVLTNVSPGIGESWRSNSTSQAPAAGPFAGQPAGITLVSLTTITSPALRYSGRSKNRCVRWIRPTVHHEKPPVGRALDGRRAINSSGRSKKNHSSSFKNQSSRRFPSASVGRFAAAQPSQVLMRLRAATRRSAMRKHKAQQQK
jgi:hypothetical protein